MHSSSRNNAKVKWVVIHTAEGARTVDDLFRFFQDTSDPNRGSSHAGIDDQKIGAGGSWVPYERAAWTLRDGNVVSDNAELCAWARWTRTEWLRHNQMLTLTAKWIADRCTARGIPIRKLTPKQVGEGLSGVLGHVDYTFGTGDGTHTDPGPNFPWDIVIPRAQAIAQRGEDDMATPAETWGYNLPGEADMRQQLVDARKAAERAVAIVTENQREIRALATSVNALLALEKGN